MRELASGVRLLESADYRRMRWKNGRGWTTEITVFPAEARFDDKPFEWRVSLAEIENDGEFSAFPGYDRTILLAEGAGMELSFDAAPNQRFAEPYKPFRFKGEWQTCCRLLNGPVRDFNVMTMRSKWQHHCEMLRGAALNFSDKSGLQAVLAYCFRDEAEIQYSGTSQVKLQAAETALCCGASAVNRLWITPSTADTILAV
ncbi:MAG: HutD family protein, partial [Gammaproteobacteria bacterium]|nr:HutD family protein [Gammaproteobacteria bacterium]